MTNKTGMPLNHDTAGNTALPLNLYKANLELQVRINKLLQESARQWLDMGNRLVGDGIAESNAEVESLLQAQDWQKLASLPAETFWRQLQQRFGDSQAATQIAISAQTAFTTGLQQAVQTWQKETASAVGTAANDAALNAANKAWESAVQQWSGLWAAPAVASTDTSKNK